MQTPRLILRSWTDADRAPFAALNADPEVMRHFPATLERRESDALADRIAAHIEREGWGLWAIEVRDSGEFIGFTGLSRPGFDAPFTPAVEVGWRLARSAWGFGYAAEAAREAVAYGFDTLQLDEIVSFTSGLNTRSIAVMDRIGMRRDEQGDFDHPLVEPGSPLRRHVLYRIANPTVRAESARQLDAAT